MVSLLSSENGEIPSVIPVKPVLTFTHCSVSMRKGRFLFLVMPDIVNRESILGAVRMDPRLKLAGMTEGEMDTRLKPRV